MFIRIIGALASIVAGFFFCHYIRIGASIEVLYEPANYVGEYILGRIPVTIAILMAMTGFFFGLAGYLFRAAFFPQGG